jgi:hypothetical protein
MTKAERIHRCYLVLARMRALRPAIRPALWVSDDGSLRTARSGCMVQMLDDLRIPYRS